MRKDESSYIGKRVSVIDIENRAFNGDVVDAVFEEGEEILVIYRKETGGVRRISLDSINYIHIVGHALMMDLIPGKNETRTEEHIEECMENLNSVWKMHRDMRFGQLIYLWIESTQTDGFYMEDHALFERLLKLEANLAALRENEGK